MTNIGVEIEILLKARQSSKFSDLNEFAGWFVEEFNKSTDCHFDMHANIDDDYDGSKEVSEWSLTDDSTLGVNPDNYTWPVELVSPILVYDDRPSLAYKNWRAEVEEFWMTMNGLCSSETTDRCGTHIHMSPGVGRLWALGEVKMICKAVIYFEHAWEVLVPESCHGNQYAKSNRYDNPRLKALLTEECFDAINECNDAVEIADLMNNNGDRYYAWNFTNFYYGRKLTVEFRRGPGVTNFQECFSWVELAVCFATAARQLGDDDELKGFDGTVSGLKEFIFQNLAANPDRSEAMENLFEGKSGSKFPTLVERLDAEQLALLAQKKNRDDKKDFLAAKMHSMATG